MFKSRKSDSVAGRLLSPGLPKLALLIVATFLVAPVNAQTAPAIDATDEEIDPYSNTALNYQDNLPYGGLFYGNPTGGVHTANTTIAEVNSRRFRAERSGLVDSVKYQNRILTQNTIDSRCAASNNQSENVLCKCKQAGLDAKSCSYTLSSSYHVGNGGLITIEIRPDDGTGLPSDTVLGKSAPYVPYDLQHNDYLSIKLLEPTYIESGNIYHLVYNNSKPPIKCPISHVELSKANSCDRDRGAIGLNGVFYPHSSSNTGSKGPWFGTDSAANLYQRKAGETWQVYPKSLSWFELAYADGVHVGDSYHALNLSRSPYKQSIEGSSQVRQRFTVLDVSRTVDGVWLNFGHTPGANGSPLSVVLKNESGDELATGRIASSAYCMQLAEGNGWDRNCRDWGYTEFNHPTDLIQNSTYFVEFSAPAGAGFEATSMEPLSISHGFNDRNNWKSAYAEISSNGGRSWNDWSDRMPKERDMSVLFTITGMPRQMP